MPVVESDDICTYIIKTATFTFRSDGTYSSVAQTSFSCDGEAAENDTETETGTYDIDGHEITLTSDEFEDEITFTFTITGSSLRLTADESGVLVLKKR